MRLYKGSQYLRIAAMELLGPDVPLLRDWEVCDQESCRKDLENWQQDQFIRRVTSSELLSDPLSSLQEMHESATEVLLSDTSAYKHVCHGCKRRLLQALDACRRYIWDQLPYFFGIEPVVEGKDYGYARYL